MVTCLSSGRAGSNSVRRAFLKSEPVPDFATHSSLVFGEFSARLPWNTSPLAFAADFITLHADEFSKHPVSYGHLHSRL